MSGVSLSRRIQRMYLEAWQLPRAPGVRASLYAAVALGALILELALLSFIRSLLREIPFDWAAGLTGSLLSSVVVWTSIPWLLLNRRVAWQRLLPAGILAGGLSTAVGLRHHRVHAAPDDVLQRAVRPVRGDRRAGRVAAVHLLHHRGVHGRSPPSSTGRPRPWATRLRYPWTESQLRPDRAPDRGGAGVGTTAAGAPSADDP